EFKGDPRVREQVISMALPDRMGNWTTNVEFTANIESHVSGEQTSRAVAKFDSPIELGQTTPVAETIMIREPGLVENEGYVLDLKFDVLSAELSAEDMLELDLLIEDWQGVQDIRISAVGHSDSQPISPANQHLFADNYALSRARANAAADYVATALGVAPGNVQAQGRGPDEPVADNATRAGRQANRRVEMVLSGVRPRKASYLEVTKASSGTQVIETRGAVPGTEGLNRKRAQDAGPEPGTMAAQIEPDIDTLSPGISMLLPAKGYDPAIPATKVSVKHAPSQTVAVWINGSPASAITFEGVTTNRAGSVAVSRWKGINLVDGENVIRAVVSNADGRDARTITRKIYYTGLPIRGELVPEQSTLIADGKTRPVVAIRLFDRRNNTARPGMRGGFRVASPYRSWWEVENDRRNQLVQLGAREPTYQVGQGGIALIELEPTTRTGEITLTLNFENNRQQEIRTWIKPAPRDWILVGFAEGTAAYNTLSDNVDAAMAAGLEDEYADEGRVAFFAKGQIRGEYLLTLAYDSDRERDRSAFETVVDPNRYYALYGDTSEQRFEAASQRKLYVKLERNVFYALFGDYDTGLSVTELARYERRFNGFKSEFRGDNAGYSVFAAQTDQQFNRDEIRGDGTSGLYQLSNAPIIANSDVIRIEVRDRFDSGVVLSSTTLSRFLDYNLDTLRGTVYFKKPVPSRDLDFNPVFIVAEYESVSTDTDDVVAGGRASLKTSNDRVEVGVTHVNDQTTGAAAQLTGVDLRWQINDQTLLKAEIADSEATISGVAQDGKASKVELEHNGENLDVKAYIREVEDGFGLGYQNAADAGVRRLGVDARARVGERWYVEGEAGWQQVLATEDIRNLLRAKLRYERQTFSATLGATHAEDKFEDGDSRTSDLAELGLAKKLFDGRLTLRASGTTSLNDDAESVDFPNRLVFGADYRLSRGIDLVAEYEQADGRDVEAQMTRVGVRATPWARAQVDTSLTNEYTEFGPRLFANVGLVQGFQVSERWTLDIGADHSNTILEPTARPIDPDRELPSGSYNEDFVAVFAGALYTADLWSANTRVEYRNSDTEERTGALFGWYREPSSGHGLSAGLTMFRT
ncbi:MAG: OmpA family protein, partial [Woeseiaceae bacterium]|nr:OmpA family protein [Woeseiaceae bacterium]